MPHLHHHKPRRPPPSPQLLLSRLILVEHEGADLDALPSIIIRVGGVAERSVGDTPRAAIELGVEALDQGDLVGLLAVEEVPLMVRVGAHGEGLALAGRVNEADGDEVGLRDTVGVRDGERVLQDLLDRPPYVDDLVARLQEPVGLVGQVVWHPRLGRAVRLVDVDAVHRPA